MLVVLRQRDFGLLWLGGLISLTGDRAMRIALPVYVYQQTGSTLATAGMATTYYLPAVMLGSVVGVFVDRWDRRKIMIVTNLIQTSVMLLVLLVRSDGWLWLVYAVSLLDTTVSIFFQTAENAVVPNIVDEEHLVPANSLGAMNNSLARLAGPPIGGLLIGLFGLASVALFNAASFLIAAGLFWLISAQTRTTPAASDVAGEAVSAWVRVWREWLEGLVLVPRDRLIAVLFVVMSVTSFGGAMIDPLFHPFALSELRADPASIGWLLTTYAIGGLFAGVVVGWIGSKLRPWHLTSFGTVLTGLFMVTMYNQTSLPVVMFLGFLRVSDVHACGWRQRGLADNAPGQGARQVSRPRLWSAVHDDGNSELGECCVLGRLCRNIWDSPDADRCRLCHHPGWDLGSLSDPEGRTARRVHASRPRSACQCVTRTPGERCALCHRERARHR